MTNPNAYVSKKMIAICTLVNYRELKPFRVKILNIAFKFIQIIGESSLSLVNHTSDNFKSNIKENSKNFNCLIWTSLC